MAYRSVAVKRTKDMHEATKGRASKYWPVVYLLISGTMCAAPAHADIEYFPYTYGWMTPSKNETEIEIKHTSPTSAHHWQDSISLEHGITNRWMIEPYLVINRSGGFGDPPSTTGVDGDDAAAIPLAAPFGIQSITVRHTAMAASSLNPAIALETLPNTKPV